MNPIEIIAPAALALLGAFFIVSAVRDILAGLASRRWPTTRARVLSVGYHHGLLSRVGDESADIRYEYSVSNRQYESNRFAFSGRGTGRSSIEIGSKYKPGDVVRVFYDPKRPQVVCISPGTGVPNYLMLFLGFLFLIPAIIWFTLLVGAS